MAKTITVKEGGFVALRDFKHWIDVSKVVYFNLKHDKKENTLKIKFYDAKKKLVRPYGQK